MRPLYNRRNILILLSLIILVSSAFIFIIYRNIRKAVTETRNINNSLQSLRVLEDLMDDMQDIESGQRGYIISGNRKFLESYFTARKNIEIDSPAVRSLQNIYPLRSGILEKLLYFVRQKANITAETVATMDRNQPDSAEMLIQSGRGREAMDSIRSLVFYIENEDRSVLHNANTERQVAARRSARSLVILVIVLLVGLLYLFSRLFRGLRHSREYEKKILYLANLTEKSSDAIFSTDINGIILSWNSGAEAIYGYSKAEAIGKFAPDITRSDFTPKELAAIIAKLPEKGSTDIEGINYNRKGEAITCLASVTALKDDNGVVNGFVTVLRDISERKRSEAIMAKFNEELNRQVEEKTAAILESKERFRQIVETAQEGIWMIDKDSRTSFVNDRMAEMLGYSRDEMIGKHLFDFMDEEGKTISERNLQRRRDGIAEDHEFKLLTKDGRVVWTLMSTSPVTNNGEYEGALAMVMDITERKKAADEIKRSQESFELISRTTNDAIWEWNLETNELWANENHQRLYGLTMDHPVPNTAMWAERIHPDDREAIISRQEETLASDKNVFISEYRFRTEANGFRDIYDRCYIVRNQEGKPIRMTGSMMDITERKQVEAELRKSEARYRSVIEQASDAIMITDQEGNFIDINSGFCKKFGYTKQELIGLNINKLIDPEQLKNDPIRFDVLIAGHSVFRERKMRHKDGTIIEVEANVKMLPDGRILAIARDITERKIAEEVLRESEERYRTLVENAPEALVVLDMEKGKFVSVSESAVRLFKMSREELLQIGPLEVSPERQPDGRLSSEVAMERIGEAIRWQKPGFEWTHCDKEGRLIPCEIRLVRLPAENQVLIRGSVTDISERKKAEQAIRSIEETRMQIMNASLDAIVCINAKGLITVWTAQAEKIFGWKEHEIIGQLLTDTIIPEEYRERHTNGLFHYLQSGHGPVLNRLIEIAARNKEGKTFPVELSIIPFKQDEAEFFCAYIRDITERKLSEEQINREKELSDTAVNSLPGIFYMFDINRKFLRWNKNFELVSGYSGEELTKLSPVVFFAEEDRERARQKVEETFRNGSAELEAGFRTRSGKKIPYFFTGRTVYYNGIKCMVGTGIDISDLKWAQREIIESENRLRTIIRSEPQCIKLLDKNGILLDMNPAGLAMIEADSLEQVKGRTVLSVIDETYRQPFRDLTISVFNDKPGNLLFSITGLKGTRRWLETHAVPMKDAEGKILALLGVTLDVTARKLAEEELRKNEEKYRTLVEQAVDAIALYDATGKILDVNTGSVNLLGYSKPELMKMSLSDILTKEEIESKPVRYDVLQQGESTIKQRHMRRKDGSVVETEVRSQQLPDGRFLSVIRDLTERIKAQQQIEEEKKLSDKLIDGLPGVFYWYDENGRFLRWNRQFEIVSGYTPKELSGKRLDDFFEGADRQIITENISRVFAEGAGDAEADFISRDKIKHPYYFKSVRIIYNNRPCLLGTGIDISDRKKAEQDLAATNESLRKLTAHLQHIREEERSHIAREIHDELGQQLTVLKMDISWLNKKIDVKEEKVKERLRDLISMVDNTVKSVRKISSELRPSMLDDLGLPAALEWQGQEFEKRFGIQVKFRIQAGDYKLPNNISITLFRIFQEGLTNIARHSEATGVSVSLKIEQDHLLLTIQDNGKGFVVHDIVNKKTLGILGMRERISLIKGAFSLESAPGKGTKIKVTVPVSGNDIN